MKDTLFGINFSVPVGFIGPFLILHGLLASSYLIIQHPWGVDRFSAMFAPALDGVKVSDSNLAYGMFHFFIWFSALLGVFRIYSGVGIIMGNDAAIHMTQITYVTESLCYLQLRGLQLADDQNTMAPAYLTILGLVVLMFRDRQEKEHND